MKYENKTIIELKDICKRREIKGYSKLNKSELIRLIKKHLPKTSKMGKTKSVKKMRGGDNTGSGTIQGNVSLSGSILTIMLFIGDNVESFNKVELKKFYHFNTIKAMTVDELRNMLIENSYYKYTTIQEYFILKKLVELKNINKINNFKKILNNGITLLTNKTTRLLKNNGSLVNTNKDELYRTYKLYKKYKSYIDNKEFEDGNEPELVVALDNSIIYSTKPFRSKNLQDRFEEIHYNKFTNNRNNKLKINNKVYTLEGIVNNTKKNNNLPTKTDPWSLFGLWQ